MYRKILVPLDRSDLSFEAVPEAIALALSLGAALTFASVSPPYAGTPRFDPECDKLAGDSAGAVQRTLQQAVDRSREAGVPAEVVHFVASRPWEGIVAAAEAHQCDLIVMTSHGRKALSAFLLGSETLDVISHTNIPVLVLRPERASAANDDDLGVDPGRLGSAPRGKDGPH